MSKQDVNKSLYRIAARCVNEGQFTLAINCFVAVLSNDPVPDDYVLCTLDLARIYIDHTTNGEEAQRLLKQLVRINVCAVKPLLSRRRRELAVCRCGNAPCNKAHKVTTASSAVQLVRLKDDNTRVDERCSCCSLLIRASLEEGDLQAAQKHCLRAFAVLDR